MGSGTPGRTAEEAAMDFEPTEEEQAIQDLTEQILTDMSTHSRLKELDAAGDSVDREAWRALADAGVVGCCVPEAHGGAGLGFMAAAKAVEVAARHGSPVPLLSTVVSGAIPIVEFGTPRQQSRWLPHIASGGILVAAALHETGMSPSRPKATAVPINGGWRISGAKAMVDGGLDATLLLVPAELADGGIGVFLVPSDSEGISIERVEVTTGRPQAGVQLDSVEVADDALLGGGETDGRVIVDWMVQRITVAMCMQMAGAARAAIELAAEYTKQRFQFDRAIATFQAVSNRAGDTYIDTEAVRLTAYQAAWRLDQGLDATDQIHMAKWWAAEAGFRVVHGAVHVHGGVGVDRDYPLHRHFLLARQIELMLGTGEQHLVELGKRIAAG